MDLHIVGPAATPEERAAIDAFLDPLIGPAQRRLGRRRARRRGRWPGRPRRARGPRPPGPAPADPPRDPGPDRLDQPGRAQPRLPAPDGPARGRVRRRHVLRAAVDRPGPPPSPTSATTWPAASRARSRSARTWSATLGPPATPRRAPRPRGCAARASASASARRRRCSRSPATRRVRIATGPADAARHPGRLGTRRTADRTGLAGHLATPPTPERLAAMRQFVPQAGEHGLRLLARVGRVDPTSLTDYLAAAATARCGGDRAGPGPASSRRSSPPRSWGAAAPRSRPVGSGRRSQRLRRPQVHRVQRGRGRARHVQGPRDPRGGSVLTGRGDDDRSLRGRRGARASSTSAASTPWPRHAADAIQVARAPATSARTPGRRLRFRHRDPARRRRLHLRRGDRVLESIEGKRGEPRNEAAVPRRVGPVPAGRRSSTTSRRSSTSRGSCSRAARSTPPSAPAAPPATSCSASPATSRGPASTRCRSGDAPRADRARGRRARRARESRPSTSVGRRASSSGPSPWTCRSRTRRAGRRDPRRGAIIVFDETTDMIDVLRRIAEFFRDESCGQCVPCRVGTVRQEELLARLAARRPNGSGRRARPPRGPGPGPARRIDLRARPDGERRRADGAALRGGALVSEPPRPSDLHRRRPGDLHPAAPPGRPSCPTAPPPARPAGGDHHRRRARHRPPGLHDPRRLPRPGHRHPHALLRETLAPEGVCRMCVVDTGGRVLTPSCSAEVTQGMTVETDNDRVRHSRKLVLELLGSSVDVASPGPSCPTGRSRIHGALRRRPVAVRAGRAARPRPGSATRATPATTTPPTAPPPRPSRSR